MKIWGLDGKQYNWYLVGKEPSKDSGRPRSELHLQIREIIKSCYPSYKLLEEVPLPGSGGLFGDFYLPQLKMMVEAHGRQHYEFVPHFHGSAKGFINSRKRDSAKEEWCTLNKITLVVCPHWENENVWRNRINLEKIGG